MKRRKPQKHKAKKTSERPHLHLVGMEVDNPDWEPSRDGQPGFPRKERQQVNVRESAVMELRNRGALSDVQFRAAERFRQIWERAGRSGPRAIDWRKEAVDGGRTAEPIGPAQIESGRELDRARALLGERMFRLVGKIAGEGSSLYVAGMTKRARLTAADNLRDSLDDLAFLWGFSSRKPDKTEHS